jgi:hypothetical protein
MGLHFFLQHFYQLMYVVPFHIATELISLIYLKTTLVGAS